MPLQQQTARIAVVDSHTGGEPTRVVISGGPDLGAGPLRHRRELFRTKYDHIRSALVNEPRGSDAIVGALLCPPFESECATGVIFFNNVGFLGMCGHGTIGVAVTMAHLGMLAPGAHRFDTPVGIVDVELHSANEVSFTNVQSYRTRMGVKIDVSGYGQVMGDVAWGGNWFFLTPDSPVELRWANLEELTRYAWAVRKALVTSGISGDDGAEIDHIELFGAPTTPDANSKNFVLCPGGSYDRSPCGTGTSAKMACLYAAGELREGGIWRQESLIGSIFEGSVRICNGQVLPRIRGTAYVTGEATLVLDSADPFCFGIK